MDFMAIGFMIVCPLSIACSSDEGSAAPGVENPSPEPGKSDENDDKGNGSGDDSGAVNGKVLVKIGNAAFTATLDDNAAARAFVSLLPMTLEMDELNGNEKYCYLSRELPAESYRPGLIRAGDLMLYGSNCVVLFYETFSSGYSYTRLGHIDAPDGLAAAAGNGKATVTFETIME